MQNVSGRSWLVQNSRRTPHIDTVFSQGPWTYNPLLPFLLQKKWATLSEIFRLDFKEFLFFRSTNSFPAT